MPVTVKQPAAEGGDGPAAIAHVTPAPCSSCRHSTGGSPSRRALEIARAAETPAARRGQAGDAVGHGRPADLPAVGPRPEPGRRVDDQVDVAALDPVEHVRGAFADLVEPLHRHAHACDRLGGAACGHDLKAVVVQDLGDRERTGLVGVGDRDEGRPLARQRHTGGRLGLGERRGEVARYAHHLARRAHLRAEHGVGALEAVERQHRLLDRHVLAVAHPLPALRQASMSRIRSPSMIRQASFASGTPTAFDTKGTVRDARGLASITYSSAGVDRVLDVEQPHDPDARGRSRGWPRGSARASPRRASAAAARRRCRRSARRPPRRAA